MKTRKVTGNLSSLQLEHLSCLCDVEEIMRTPYKSGLKQYVTRFTHMGANDMAPCSPNISIRVRNQLSFS